MAYQALYRKWRPLSFDDVVGQGHIVTTLKNEIMAGKAAHAYLFCGTRGTGKTSCAKIFARAVNCLKPQNGNPCNECEICRGALEGSVIDITEIDAASNNGVDNIRAIREEVSYSAAQTKYKIYIIDEVHMLSSGAFNALLKTLEEPPAHVIFILATTEVHKLPATITSRCQRFDFKRIAARDMLVRLREIVNAENIDADIEALELIARLSDGAMRDALSILDQCVGACDGKITLSKARDILSVASDEALGDMVDAIANKDAVKILSSIAEVSQSGKDINNFIDMLIGRFRDILVCKVSNTACGLFEYCQDTIDEIKRAASAFGAAELSYIIETLCAASADAKWEKNVRTLYELALMRLCDDRLSQSSAAILSRLEALELKLDGKVIKTVQKSSKEEQKPHTEEQHQNENDDTPPWDMPKSDEDIINKLKKEEKALQTDTEQKNNIKDQTLRKVSVKKSSNVWGELLGVLQKKYPPLYGALSVKKAKFDGQKLYIINESYVKQIITMLSDDFNTALASVVGEGVRVCFVTESEFDMIDDMPESAKAEDVATTVQTEDETDPLDALLSMENDDIIVEE